MLGTIMINIIHSYCDKISNVMSKPKDILLIKAVVQWISFMSFAADLCGFRHCYLWKFFFTYRKMWIFDAVSEFVFDLFQTKITKMSYAIKVWWVSEFATKQKTTRSLPLPLTGGGSGGGGGNTVMLKQLPRYSNLENM